MRRLTIDEALRAQLLKAIELRILLAHALDVDHALLIAHGSYTISDAERARFDSLYACRLAGESVAYLS